MAFTVLTDINDNGIAVGYYMDTSSVQHSFIYNSNTHTFTFIPNLAVSNSENGPFHDLLTHTVATAINDQGIVVGYYGVTSGGASVNTGPDRLVHGFVYNSGTGQFITTEFQPYGHGPSAPLGINDYGMMSARPGKAVTRIVVNLQPDRHHRRWRHALRHQYEFQHRPLRGWHRPAGAGGPREFPRHHHRLQRHGARRRAFRCDRGRGL